MSDMANKWLRLLYRRKQAERHSALMQRPVQSLRTLMTNAKVFRLDERMSEYVGHLSTVPFKVDALLRRYEALDSIRYSARLPFPVSFIQFNNRALRKGLLAAGAMDHDIMGNKLVTDEQCVEHEAWLCTQPCEGLVHVSVLVDWEEELLPMNFSYMYSTTDEPVRDILKREFGHEKELVLLDEYGGVFAHGVHGYYSPHVALIAHHQTQLRTANEHTAHIVDESRGLDFYVPKLAVEFSGSLRYLMCFLAALNDAPVTYETTRPAKGFLGAGKIRPFIETSTVRLVLPKRHTLKTLAMRAVAVIRRRGHPVRGHWRVFANPGAYVCGSREVHKWSATDEDGRAFCASCTAKRKWIKDYETGKEIGFTVPRYEVEHHT